MRYMKSDYLLAIDIGGSKYMIALLDTEGKIIESNRYMWQELSARIVIESIIRSTRELLNKHKGISPIAIGVTIPGLADPKEGIWIEASFSGIRNINIRHLLESEFGIAVYIDNDAQACALAEKLFGSCKSTKNFIYMTISNGVGGALFINDDLYYGGFGNAGEIGHCIVVEDGNQCNCGNKGCLEMHASGPALVRNYIELGGSSRYFGKLIDAKNIAELAYKGDEIAIRTFELEGYYLGKIIALISNVINPEKVIIGGGVSLSFSLFEKSLKESLRNHLYVSANKNLEVSASQFGYNGGVFGAASIAICGKEHKYNWGLV